MSLVIGVQCSDGIVIGADSAATFGGMLRDTIRQTAKKIRVIQDRAIIGSSGLAGLGQRYAGELDELLKKSDRNIEELPAHRLMAVLQQTFSDATHETMQSHVIARKFTEVGALNSGLAGTLVAIRSAGELTLLAFDEVCNPERLTADIPFTSVGNGQMLADPFLAYIKRVLWSGEQPSLALGVLGTVWTLQHAISVAPGGVADPLHIYQMTLNEGGGVNIVQIAQESIDDLTARIQDIELGMRDLATRSVQTTPPPPPPSIVSPSE